MRIALVFVFVLGASRMARAEKPAVPVRFVAEDMESSTILVDATRCRTPCTLPLTPGYHHVTVLDTRNYTRDLFVPDAPSLVRIEDDLQPQLIAGIVLTTLGVTAYAWVWAPFQYCCLSQVVTPYRHEDNRGSATVFLIIYSFIPFPFVLTGVGLLGYSATHPPTDGVDSVPLTTKGALPLKLLSFGLQPIHNGLGGGLTFAF